MTITNYKELTNETQHYEQLSVQSVKKCWLSTNQNNLRNKASIFCYFEPFHGNKWKHFFIWILEVIWK